MSIEDFVKSKLAAELATIEKSRKWKKALPELSVFEKAVIYSYSDEGFKDVNPPLRKSRGKDFTELALHLHNALAKLPDFDGLVYRKVYLTPAQLNRYKTALKGNKTLKEYWFVSTTKDRLVAEYFEGTTNKKPNCLFRIVSRTGKDIEKIAKFEEKEVLFRPNTIFNVIDIRKEADYTLITMEEA